MILSSVTLSIDQYLVNYTTISIITIRVQGGNEERKKSKQRETENSRSEKENQRAGDEKSLCKSQSRYGEDSTTD